MDKMAKMDSAKLCERCEKEVQTKGSYCDPCWTIAVNKMLDELFGGL